MLVFLKARFMSPILTLWYFRQALPGWQRAFGNIFIFHLRFLNQVLTGQHHGWAWAAILLLPLLITTGLIITMTTTQLKYPAEGG